ncbi:exodeoxyribonuclease V subunit alpha [Gallibacterium trehalosifermentans]|uniref:RecBCD enzyme subunit RecD n=1 Tax=Gallibacterium trehalosifermentans TaxID=516935 RepID=A0ABV6GYS9_9PAST
MLTILRQLREAAIIEQIDYYFAQLIYQQGTTLDPKVNNLATLLAALLSFHHQRGHSCLYLSEDLLANPFELLSLPEGQSLLHELRQSLPSIPVTEWHTPLLLHAAFSSDQQQVTPIVLRLFAQDTVCYLHRIWQDEYYIAQRLANSKVLPHTAQQLSYIEHILSTLFVATAPKPDWQKIAVATAFSRTITFISGGPGTGKTTTVAKLLLGLQWLQRLQQQPPLSIRLAAPTGKAATRLTESLHQAVQQIQLPLDFTAELPQEAATIHRLLGMHPNSPPTYHQQRPLNIDVLVVDEASMIDLATMALLLRGVHPNTRLIFLGDKDQLASVEVGAIMAELGQFLPLAYSQPHADYLQHVCGQTLAATPQCNFIRDSLCHLQHSYRFRADKGIGQLANAVNQGAAEQSWQLFSRYEDIQVLSLSNQQIGEKNHHVVQFACTLYREYFMFMQQQTLWTPAQIAQAFALFKRNRLLSALRSGALGVEQLNQQIAEMLRQQKHVTFRAAHEWYLGKPVIVLQNDHNVRLFNGDIGLVLPDEQGNLKVWFETESGFRGVLPSRVPSVESAYVMTVHKSQGSEFNHTVLVLPQEFNALLTRELIYTAITRAKDKFTVFSEEMIWLNAVQRRTFRASGLATQIKRYFYQGEENVNCHSSIK